MTYSAEGYPLQGNWVGCHIAISYACNKLKNAALRVYADLSALAEALTSFLSCARPAAAPCPSLWTASARSQNNPYAETYSLNQGRSKCGPQNHRVLFLFYFEKNYAILFGIKAPFCRRFCPVRVTVVRVGVDRTIFCTDYSQCRTHASSPSAIAIQNLWLSQGFGSRCVLRQHGPLPDSAIDGFTPCGTSRGPIGAGTWSVLHPAPHTLRCRGARCMMVA